MIMSRTIGAWSAVMEEVFQELFRITLNGGWVAFEVGEIKGGKVKLDEYIIPAGLNAGFNCAGIIINLQQFTKTAHIWGVKNNTGGTTQTGLSCSTRSITIYQGTIRGRSYDSSRIKYFT